MIQVASGRSGGGRPQATTAPSSQSLLLGGAATEACMAWAAAAGLRRWSAAATAAVARAAATCSCRGRNTPEPPQPSSRSRSSKERARFRRRRPPRCWGRARPALAAPCTAPAVPSRRGVPQDGPALAPVPAPAERRRRGGAEAADTAPRSIAASAAAASARPPASPSLRRRRMTSAMSASLLLLRNSAHASAPELALTVPPSPGARRGSEGSGAEPGTFRWIERDGESPEEPECAEACLASELSSVGADPSLGGASPQPGPGTSAWSSRCGAPIAAVLGQAGAANAAWASGDPATSPPAVAKGRRISGVPGDTKPPLQLQAAPWTRTGSPGAGQNPAEASEAGSTVPGGAAGPGLGDDRLNAEPVEEPKARAPAAGMPPAALGAGPGAPSCTEPREGLASLAGAPPSPR